MSQQIPHIKTFETCQIKKNVNSFLIGKKVPEDIRCTVRIQPQFEDNFREETMTVRSFILYMQSEKAHGMKAEITEEDLLKMLEYVRSQKNKVYSIKEDSS